MNTPNIYRLEMNHHAVGAYNACLSEPLDIRDGHIYVPDRPGLGYSLDRDYVESHLDTQWARLIG